MGKVVDDRVKDEEHYLRWIYDPRHIIKDVVQLSFISLKPKEEGVSGQIYERLESEAEIYKAAKSFERNKEAYWGYAMASVGEIRSIAMDDDKIDVLMTVSKVPAHAEIRFAIDGEQIVGNTPNPRLSYYFNEIKELLCGGLVKRMA